MNYRNKHNTKKGNNIDNNNNNIISISIMDDVIPIVIVRMIFT